MPPKGAAKAKKAAQAAEQQMRFKAGSVSVAGITSSAGATDDGGGGFTSVAKKPPKKEAPPAYAAAAAVASRPREPERFVPQDYVPGAAAVPEPAKQKQKPKPAPKPAKKKGGGGGAAAAKSGDWEELPDDVGFSTVTKEKVRKPKPKEAQAPTGPKQEKRVDPSDGEAYTQQEFVECYGDVDGMDVWRRAKVEKVLTAAERAQKEYWDKEREAKLKAAQNAAVVGAGGAPAAKTKKELQDEKKAREKAEKRRKREEEEARQRREQERGQHHQDPTAFVAAVGGVKPQKAAHTPSLAAQFGQSTVYGKKGGAHSSHVKLPKAQKERAVGEIDPDALARFQQQMKNASSQAKPKTAELSFKVRIQGKWYTAAELLARQDFAHAPELVKAYVVATEKDGADDTCIGGYFITQEGKEWANEHTVDEFWMSSSYAKALTKLLEGGSGVQELHPYWGKTGLGGGQADAATAQIEIAKASLVQGAYPTVTLKHKGKHGSQLQEISVGVYDFTSALLAEADMVVRFVEKIEQGCNTVGEMAKFKTPERASAISTVRDKLPKNIHTVVSKLSSAFDSFRAKYPEPAEE